MRFRRDIHRGISGNARERVPTQIGKRCWIGLRGKDYAQHNASVGFRIFLRLSTHGILKRAVF